MSEIHKWGEMAATRCKEVKECRDRIRILVGELELWKDRLSRLHYEMERYDDLNMTKQIIESAEKRLR